MHVCVYMCININLNLCVHIMLIYTFTYAYKNLKNLNKFISGCFVQFFMNEFSKTE